MNFNSLEFLLFLPAVLLLYWLIPHKFRWAVLLVASYYFYMSWNVWLVFAILGTTAASYGAGILIGKAQKTWQKKVCLIITIAVCLGMLVFFKYFNFLLQNAIDFLNLFSLHIDSVALNIILPVGISFYTFQTLSYVIDVYRGKFKPEKHFGYYALFVSYFPQLVAGPIERAGDLLPQLRAEHRLNIDDVSEGFKIMICGFFRKCVVADFCGIFVNRVFADIGGANSLAVFLAAILFFIQLYCDFAGYSEIAIGCARMMGVRLTKNFDRPELSLSATEFFRRWHITLNRWFTDYVYIPLGGSKKGVARKIFNTMIVFILCGLWHGANWTFVLWGVYAGAVVCIEGLLKRPLGNLLAKKKIDAGSLWIVAIKRIWAVSIAVTTSLLFRSQSIAEIGVAFSGLFTKTGMGGVYLDSALNAMGLDFRSALQLILSVLCMYLLYRYCDDKPHEKNTLPCEKNGAGLKDTPTSDGNYMRRVSVCLYIILAVALCWFALIAAGDASTFQYFQF